MSSQYMNLAEWTQIHAHILRFEQEGLVSRTFRRLDPQRQQAILLAVLDEAAEKGPGQVSIKQVARRAGVSVGSLYTYFPDRDGMLAFAVQLCVRFITASFDEYRSYLLASPLRQALQWYLAGGIEWSQAYASLLRLFARAAYHGEAELAGPLVRPIANLLREMVHDMLAAASERGEIRPGVDLEATARIVHALTIAVGDSQLLPYLNTYFQVTADEVPAGRALQALLDLVMRGIGHEEEEEGNG